MDCLNCFNNNLPVSDIFIHFCTFSISKGKKIYPGLEKIKKTTDKKMACCMTCFRNPLKTLDVSLVATHTFSPSNLVKHMSTAHKNDKVWQQFLSDNAHASGQEENKDKKNGKANQKGISQHSVTSVTNTSSFTNAFARTKIPKIIIERGNHLMFQFMRSCNIAASHSNSNEMLAFFEHVMENSRFYQSNKQHLMMGFHKYRNQQFRFFANMIDLIKKMVKRTRSWIMEETSSTVHVPFISVAHNGWDSKDHDMIGVSIHFIDVKTKQKRTIAVGLQRLYSKKSVDVANHVLNILLR